MERIRHLSFMASCVAFVLILTAVASCGSDARVGPINASVERAAAAQDAPAQEWTRGINQAGWEFHQTLDGNAISSPVSIGTAFSLLRAGASPATAQTLDEIFNFPAGNDSHVAANAVLQDLASSTEGETVLDVNNRLFVKDTPLMPFVDTAAEHYGADLVPLAGPGDLGADQINGWAFDMTRGLVPKIVEPAQITSTTNLVLVNAVYMKAAWQSPFAEGSTAPGSFQLSDSAQVETPFMSTLVSTRFVEHDDFTAVELRYRDGGLSMWLLVPNDVDGLAGLESSLDAETIVELAAEAESGEINLSLPKWEVELPPTDLLETWMCGRGLCSGAELDRIFPGGTLSFAVHGAKIIVDETGTEAAAVTGIAVEESMPHIVLDLQVDRPFSYVIVDHETDALVFVGRVVDPTAG